MSRKLDMYMQKKTLSHPKYNCCMQGFPGGPLVKGLAPNAGDTGSIPGPGGFHVLRGI